MLLVNLNLFTILYKFFTKNLNKILYHSNKPPDILDNNDLI